MDPTILSIETATLGGGVCLLQGNRVLATVSGDPQLSHSNTLLSDINKCLEAAKTTIESVQLFAAASGPGSFTGLRIGLATVKALAATLARPCVGIPTLKAIAHTAGPSAHTVAMLPAGRGEVFVQLFAVNDDVVGLDDPAHLPPGYAIERYAELKSVQWVGSGALTYQKLIEAKAQSQHFSFDLIQRNGQGIHETGWRVLTDNFFLAKHVAVLAKLHLDRQDLETAEDLSAIYVRPSDAELKCN